MIERMYSLIPLLIYEPVGAQTIFKSLMHFRFVYSECPILFTMWQISGYYCFYVVLVA